MIRKIFKYKINCAAGILVPRTATILGVGQEDNQPIVWAIVDPAEYEKRLLRVLFTGDDAPNRHYYGTVKVYTGFVYHVFDGGDA